MNRRWLALVVVFLAFTPQIASANAGTPLMWAGILHLVFGNAIIGLLEGAAIGFLFKRPKGRCIGIMIAANYMSAWVGGLWIAGAVAGRIDWDIYNAWSLFWSFVVGTFFLTLLIEWPFVALCFRKQEFWLKRSIKACLLIQTVSYLLLFGWYWGPSGKSLFVRMKVVQPSSLSVPSNVRLFYIGAEDGRLRDNGRVMGTLAVSNLNDRLVMKLVPDGTNAWTLFLRRDANQDENVRLEVIDPLLQGEWASSIPVKENRTNGVSPWFNFGSALQHPSVTNRWQVWTGFWPIEGMDIENVESGEEFRFAWETPFSQWMMRNAVQLPNEMILFELGSDQICVLDPRTKRIARVAKGRGFVVLIE